jgi:thiol-disulfide isomerase/thioredoxin
LASDSRVVAESGTVHAHKLKTWFSILFVLAALTCSAAGPGHELFRVRTARDIAGNAHQLGIASGTKAVVLVFLGPECPISQRYVPELNRLAAGHGTNGVEFFGVIAGQTMTRTQATAFVKEYAIQYPVIFDEGLAIARWLRPTHMPEAFVLKPDGDRLYRGRIDDWYQSPGKPRAVIQHRELRDAMDAARAGKMPRKFFAPPVGCYFEDWPAR